MKFFTVKHSFTHAHDSPRNFCLILSIRGLIQCILLLFIEKIINLIGVELSSEARKQRGTTSNNLCFFRRIHLDISCMLTGYTTFDWLVHLGETHCWVRRATIGWIIKLFGRHTMLTTCLSGCPGKWRHSSRHLDESKVLQIWRQVLCTDMSWENPEIVYIFVPGKLCPQAP